MLDLAGAERAAFEDVVALRARRDVVEASGADATAYLQGQLSQDLAAIDVGRSAWSLLLQPQGKVDSWLRLVRLEQDRWLLDTDAGAGAATIARLERFRLRMDVAFAPLDWSMVALRGPGSGAVEPPGGTVVADPAWPGLAGVDLLGEQPPIPAGAPEGDPGAYEALRIRCGVPAVGRELTERTIPAEAGIVDRSVSFTKGCYVGQELVARIDSRGGTTPRRLWLLVIEGAEVPPAGAAVVLGDQEVGEVTSAARSPERGVVALASLKRAIDAGTAVGVTAGGRPVPALVVAPPLV